jgi:hypothetical protein
MNLHHFFTIISTKVDWLAPSNVTQSISIVHPMQSPGYLCRQSAQLPFHCSSSSYQISHLISSLFVEFLPPKPCSPVPFSSIYCFSSALCFTHFLRDGCSTRLLLCFLLMFPFFLSMIQLPCLHTEAFEKFLL